MSSYTPDHAGMREFLNSPSMMRLVEDVAERVKANAQARSPVGSVADGDEHPGLYLASWHVRSHRFGGAKGDRAEAFAYNDSPDAFYVEYGFYGDEPYRVLIRAARETRI